MDPTSTHKFYFAQTTRAQRRQISSLCDEARAAGQYGAIVVLNRETGVLSAFWADTRRCLTESKLELCRYQTLRIIHSEVFSR
jgi:hypothetical protein